MLDLSTVAITEDMLIGKVPIHYSEVSQFKACRRAWDWSSRQRGNMEPKRLYAPFFFGRLVHECLELFHANGTSWVTTMASFVEKERKLLDEAGMTFEQDLIEFNEQVELAAGVLSHYFLWEENQSGPLALMEMDWLSTEQEFRVPILHPVTGEAHPYAFYEGKLDGILRRRDNGKIYICEYKTAKAVEQRAKMLPNDEQAGFYLNALSMLLGEEVEGVLYTIMAKRYPKPVGVKRNGFLSEAALDKQTLESYMAAIEMHHPGATNDYISENYGMTLMALAGQKNTYFERHVVRRNSDARFSASLDLFDVATDMVQPGIKLYPTPSFHCSYCLFREPCIQLQNGGPYRELLADQYRPRSAHAGSADADVE